MNAERARLLLHAAGVILTSERAECRIVVVGGAALALSGLHDRATEDIDVLALVTDGVLADPVPLPPHLVRAVQRVARDFGVAEDWLNAAVGAQFGCGLPPDTERDLDWQRFGGLHVGVAGRRTLIALKLYAAADQGPRSKHVADLVQLAPTSSDWSAVRSWVVAQDAAPEYPGFVDQVIRHVDDILERDR
jgi:hypothetical protein